MRKIPSPRLLAAQAFMTGVCLTSLMFGCIADFIGKERFEQYIHDTWVDSNVSMPIQIVLIVTVMMVATRGFFSLPGRKNHGHE